MKTIQRDVVVVVLKEYLTTIIKYNTKFNFWSLNSKD
jgi:hypothetical protein